MIRISEPAELGQDPSMVVENLLKGVIEAMKVMTFKRLFIGKYFLSIL